jgi:hypothetical protein
MSEKPHGAQLHVTGTSELPFDSIEGAQEYLTLLLEALEEARTGVEHDVSVVGTTNTERRLEALRLVSYKLNQLHGHLTSSHRLLNDLRTLRRLLLREREHGSTEAARSLT